MEIKFLFDLEIDSASGSIGLGVFIHRKQVVFVSSFNHLYHNGPNFSKRKQEVCDWPNAILSYWDLFILRIEFTRFYLQ
jgi:hypothetical protein